MNSKIIYKYTITIFDLLNIGSGSGFAPAVFKDVVRKLENELQKEELTYNNIGDIILSIEFEVKNEK